VAEMAEIFDFNLEYLKAFYYVAKLKSFSRASDVMFISQPAVSASIHKLERHFDSKLFERTGKGIELTAEGLALYNHVEAGLTRLMLGERELKAAKQHTLGTLRIAATETPLYKMILPRIRHFYEKYPGVFVSIDGGGSVAEAFSQLLTEQVDLAFGVTPLSGTAGLEIISGQEFEDIAVASSAFEELRGKTLSARELLEYPIVVAKRGTNVRAQLDSWFAEQGMTFEPVYSVQTSSAVLGFALYGIGIGILPSLLAEERLGENGLFRLKFEKPLPKRAIVAARRKETPLTPTAEAFLEFMNLK
jgi:DNA-binding transcriptional LysR family regulator